jgi:hypothetical protein
MSIENGNSKAIHYANKYIMNNFTFDFAFDCLKYLDTENLKKYNEYLKIHNDVNKTNHKPEFIECHVCYETNQKAFYNCKCINSTICIDCYSKSSNCPYCRKN